MYLNVSHQGWVVGKMSFLFPFGEFPFSSFPCQVGSPPNTEANGSRWGVGGVNQGAACVIVCPVKTRSPEETKRGLHSKKVGGIGGLVDFLVVAHSKR